MRRLLAAVTALVMILSMTAVFAEESAWDGAYMEADEFKAYIKNDLDVLVATIEDQLEDDAYTAVTAAKEAGDAAIDAAGTVAEVEAAYTDAVNAISDCISSSVPIHAACSQGWYSST